MATKYLYLDDESPEVVRSFIREVAHHTPELDIELMQPLAFAQQMDEFSKRSFSGIILDLRLDQFGDKVGYRATSLAQELRTRAAEGAVDCPIVLWSTYERFNPSYTRDNTGHDLFDLKCVKNAFVESEEEAKLAGSRMISLAEGYANILSVTKGSSPQLDILRCLGLEKDAEFLDPRLTSAFTHRTGRLPAHEFAGFILHSMLEIPGPLLNIDWLAARLGIDRAASSDFTSLCSEHLSDIAYNGAFSSGWPSWWAGKLEEWWQGLDRSHKSLRLTPAINRVESLRRLTKLNHLVPAEPLRPTDSTAFWTVCQATGRPIDPRDGFVLDSPNNQIWQEKLYISAYAAFSGPHRNKNLRLSILEKERFERARHMSKTAKATPIIKAN